MVGTLNRRRIAANGGAMTVQDGALVAVLLGRVDDAVPDRRIARDHAQGQALTAATDDKGRMRFLERLRLTVRLAQLVVASLKGHDGLCPEPPDQLARLLQTVNALAGEYSGMP